MSFSADDRQYMQRALELAQQGLYTTHPNPRVGCVIVKDGKIIGEGWHERAGQAHAEVHALQQAGANALHATSYVTLEPCSHFGRTPPCANTLIQAGIKRVVAAMVDPNPLVAGKGLQLLENAGITTAFGLLEDQARALNVGFISAMERQRPFMRIKMAMSVDGRTAMQSGESVWITGDAARQDVQYWRARASAILTGIGTILHDNPHLNVRLSPQDLGIQGEIRHPARVILDTHLRFPLDANILKTQGEIYIYTCSQDITKQQSLENLGVKIRRFSSKSIKLTAVLQQLYEDKFYEVHVEAGATLAGALLEQGLADELLLYIAPHLMGASARPLANLFLDKMQSRIPLIFSEVCTIDHDIRLIAKTLPN